MASAEPFVDAKLKQRMVLLFAKGPCPWSKDIREILDTYEMQPDVYEVCEIGKRADCTQMENYIQVICLTNSREVPQLFVKGKYIGGRREIPRLHDSGDLKGILRAAGAVKA